MNKRLQAELEKARTLAQIAEAKAAGAAAVVRSLERSAGEVAGDALVTAHGQGQEEAIAEVARLLGCAPSLGAVEIAITSLRAVATEAEVSPAAQDAQHIAVLKRKALDFRDQLAAAQEQLAAAQAELRKERAGRKGDVEALEAQLAEEREGWLQRLAEVAKKTAAPAPVAAVEEPTPAQPVRGRRPCDTPNCAAFDGISGLTPNDRITTWHQVGIKIGRQDELDGLRSTGESWLISSEKAVGKDGQNPPRFTAEERAEYRRGLLAGAEEAKVWREAQPDPKNDRSWAVPPWYEPPVVPQQGVPARKKRSAQQKLVE